MFRTKIHGAGSIGNYLSHVAHKFDWSVDICDTDAEALRRTKHDIYHMRYGVWDDEIKLHLAGDALKGGFDLIIIGTPLDILLNLACSALVENPELL